MRLAVFAAPRLATDFFRPAGLAVALPLAFFVVRLVVCFLADFAVFVAFAADLRAVAFLAVAFFFLPDARPDELPDARLAAPLAAPLAVPLAVLLAVLPAALPAPAIAAIGLAAPTALAALAASASGLLPTAAFFTRRLTPVAIARTAVRAISAAASASMSVACSTNGLDSSAGLS